jgi:hypothetical protein
VRRRVVLISLTTLVSLVFALGAAEMLTRLAGWNMWRAPVLDRNLPVLHEPDPILGWRNRPGSVVWPGLWSDRGRDIVMTFWQDGLRATAPERRPRRAEVPLVGCSYTQGWAVTDSETYAWQLQTMLPRVTVLNYGTAGYGTYQSLLALERHFARAPGPVPLVVYGLIESHEDRNVAPASWLRGLTTVSHGGPLAVPFVTIGSAGTLERHAPQSYPSWPLDRRLASVDLLEFAWASFESRGRLEQSVPVLEALLLEMQRVAHAHGAELVVVILDARSRGWLPRRTRFLRAHSISTVSCVHPRITSQQVPGYGHPDRVWHAYVATCLAAHLRPLIASRLRPK